MSLTSLDISANKLDAKCLNAFLQQINRNNSLRYLNLSFNSASQKGEVLVKPPKNEFEDPIEVVKVHEFFTTLIDFIHYSDSLLVIDLSCMSFDFISAKHIVEMGLRESRVLITCLMKGLDVTGEQYQELVRIIKNKESGEYWGNEKLVHLEKQVFREIFKNKDDKVKNQVEHMTDTLKKQIEKSKQEAKKALKEPPFQVPVGNEVVFERLLGCSEVLYSHRWRITKDGRARITRKPHYTIYAWNRRLHDAPEGTEFYHFVNQEPLKFWHKLECPMLQVNKKSYKMIPLQEFFARQRVSKKQMALNYRACNNESEEQLQELLQEKILDRYKEKECLHPTFWDEGQEILRADEMAEKQKVAEKKEKQQ